MKSFKLTLIAIAVALSGSAFGQTLEELAEIVRRAASEEAQINEEREAEFLRERNNQRNLLTQAQREKAAEEARSDRLKAE